MLNFKFILTSVKNLNLKKRINLFKKNFEKNIIFSSDIINQGKNKINTLLVANVFLYIVIDVIFLNKIIYL